MTPNTTPAPAVQATDEQVRAMLAVQWPALYRDSLYMDGDGDGLRRQTQERVAIARRQYAAALSVQPVPDATSPTQNSVRCAACDKPAVSAILNGVASFPTCPCGSLRFNALVGASPAATACSGLRPSAADASSPSVPPAGAKQMRTIEQLRGDAIFGIGSEWAAMLDDGVLADCYACAINEDIPLFAEEVAVARAAIFVATGSALLSGESKKAIKDAPALHGLLCRANNLLIGSPARGIDSPEGVETQGSTAQPQEPGPEGTRPDGSIEQENRRLRRMLCAQRHGPRAYMDDGEASWGGGAYQRPTDYLLEPLDAIEAAWREAGLKRLAAETAQLPQAELRDAELRAWRERFPSYVYRPQDDCVSLKLKQQEQQEQR